MRKLPSMNTTSIALFIKLDLSSGMILWLHMLHLMLQAAFSSTLAVISRVLLCLISTGPYGENLAAGYGSVAASIDAWYNEINDYNFSNGDFSVGSYTRLF
jgi:hypothetical protein